MIGWRWIGLAVLPLAALVACGDDDVDEVGAADAEVSTHAALHALADEACGDIEAAADGDRAAVIASAVAEGEALDASSDEVLEILGEECPELLPQGE